MNFLNQLLEESRLLTVLYDNLADEIKTSALYKDVELYLKKYAAFNHINAESAIAFYTNYITTYNKHCKQFIKTAKYPSDNKEYQHSISREEYDVVLLLSVLFTPHRYRIMQLLLEKSTGGNALFIGLGPGLELMLTKKKHTEIHAYDLSANKFLFAEFPDVDINIELYTGQKEDYFDSIYLIELLEHLEDPYALLSTCYTSLKKGGKILLTTATDIPQFDHLYNFPEDHTTFESELKKIGLNVLYKEQIPHNYLTMDLKPFNHFYVVEK